MAKPVQPIIIKKKKKGDHPEHSSAWKIALADFMTALMCFFLVMWLTTIMKTDTKPDVSRFFNMAGIDETDVGIGGVLGGSTITVEGPLAEMAAEFTVAPPMGAVEKNDSELLGRYLPKQEKEEVAGQDTGKTAQALTALQEQLQKDLEQEGLGSAAHVTREAGKIRVDLLDNYKRPMFRTGGHQLLPNARALLEKIARKLSNYAGSLTIQGHTDNARYRNAEYTNWELSADRANAARRAITRAAPTLKVRAVVGKGAQDLPTPDTPSAPENRRISLFFTPAGAAQKSERAHTKRRSSSFSDTRNTSSTPSGIKSEGQSAETQKTSSVSAKKRAVKYII